MSTTPKDLTREAPRSPRLRIGGYPILARSLDKGRASIAGKVGEYHFDCPLDNFLFSFKGITGAEIHTLLTEGKTDEEIIAWLNSHGTPKTEEEVTSWSDGFEAVSPYHDPEKKEWFISECETLGLHADKATLFDMLEADDLHTFAK